MQSMITYYTQVVIDKGAAKLLEVLRQQGFRIIQQKDKLVAYSDSVEAYAIKEILLKAGFSNHDFSIHLDYTRRWGTL